MTYRWSQGLLLSVALAGCSASAPTPADQLATSTRRAEQTAPPRIDDKAANKGRRIESRDHVFFLQTSHCDGETPANCADALLTIEDHAGRLLQRLKIPYATINAQYPIYEGSMDDHFVNNAYTLIISDFDTDGYADFAIYIGNEAGYGGAAYDIYLFEPASQRFVRNAALSDLTQGGYSGIFRVDHGLITAGGKSSCCDSEFSVYEFNHGKLKMISQEITETSPKTQITTVTKRTLINGDWKIQKSTEQ